VRPLSLIEGQKENKRKEGNIMNVNWKTMLVAGLTVCLAVSLFFNGYLYYKLTRPLEHHSPTFFSFVWSPEQQDITEGPLYVNMTFERIGENLSVIIKINDDDCNALPYLTPWSPDKLIIVFDANGNGTIDNLDVFGYFYWLTANNETIDTPAGLNLELLEVYPRPLSCNRRPSDFHTCTFKQGEGYVFNCTFPIHGSWRKILSDVVTLRYADFGGSVYIPPFHFGVDVT
jgi:hypothetical protein